MTLGKGTTVSGLPDWLGLAAAPTFAAMALLAASGGDADICSSMQGASLLNGMASMYGLMSLFHLPPWLRLVSGKTGAAP
ncbi:hypothetical protein GOL74_13600 [Sinorhizobium medicae]|nr:hypothetical protein [Sinorhizobium medicae]